MQADTISQLQKNDQELNLTHVEQLYPVREFRDEDREVIVEFMNRRLPPHRHWTADEWRRNDTRRAEGEVYMRLSVGEPAIGFVDMQDWSTTTFRMEGVCGFELHVAPEYRRRGIGSLLYQRVLQFARERSAKRLVTWFYELGSDDPGVAFLSKRGFSEQEREQPSYLDLSKFDPAPFADAVTKAEEMGVGMFAYSEVPDTEENRRRLYDLRSELIYDIPRRDDQPFTVDSYEDWVKHAIDRPEWAPDATYLAEVDGVWVGISQLMFKVDKNVGMTWLTGVRKAHRGKHIATALKLKAFEAAKARGCQIITTENHADNGPMLAINRKFGFVPEIPVVSYNLVLQPEQSEHRTEKEIEDTYAR